MGGWEGGGEWRVEIVLDGSVSSVNYSSLRIVVQLFLQVRLSAFLEKNFALSCGLHITETRIS